MKARIRLGAHAEPERRGKAPRSPGRRAPRLTGSIVVSVTSSPRAPAAGTAYHEIDDDFRPREGVRLIRDMGAETWEHRLSVILAPSHNCRLDDLVYGFVDELEARLARSVEFAAWSHRDTGSPHAHVVLRDPREDTGNARQMARLERQIEKSAAAAYGRIRERQREYAREQERERDRGLDR